MTHAVKDETVYIFSRYYPTFFALFRLRGNVVNRLQATEKWSLVFHDSFDN